MPFQTRSQKDMALAAKKIQDEVVNKSFAKEYKGLCHQFPVFVLQCGLAQAVAFSAAKLQGDNLAVKQAHEKLLDHIAAIHGTTGPLFIIQVRTVSMTEYMKLTRRTLDAAIFFKRFAEALIEDRETSHAS